MSDQNTQVDTCWRCDSPMVVTKVRAVKKRVFAVVSCVKCPSTYNTDNDRILSIVVDKYRN